MVMIIAGPIRLRMLQRGQRQRTSLLITIDLSTAAQTVSQHQHSGGNDQRRPEELLNFPPRKPVEVVEQQQDPNADNQKGTDRAAFAETFQRIAQGLPRQPCFGGTVGVNGHVDPQSGDANPQRRLGAAAHRAVHTKNEQQQKNGQVNDALSKLFVVERAQAGQKSQKERQQRAWPYTGSRGSGSAAND